MPMYNLNEYSDNYADTSGNLWRFKRDKQNMSDARNPDNITIVDSSSFKYKSSLLGSLVAAGADANAHAFLRNAKIVVLLNYH